MTQLRDSDKARVLKNGITFPVMQEEEPASGAETKNGRFAWVTTLSVQVMHSSLSSYDEADLPGLLTLLSQQFMAMQRTIEAHGGTIHRFDGDSLLAVFDKPRNGDPHAQQSVQAALCLMEQLSFLNQARLAAGAPSLRFGIGIHTGRVLLGTLLPGQQLGNAVFGDGVSMARRLGDLNTQTPFYAVFISDTTLAELGGNHAYHVDNLGAVQMSWQPRPVTVYSLMPKSGG